VGPSSAKSGRTETFGASHIEILSLGELFEFEKLETGGTKPSSTSGTLSKAKIRQLILWNRNEHFMLYWSGLGGAY